VAAILPQTSRDLLEKKNLALEALRRLINGEVRSQSTRNVVQSRAFTERLEAAIARYHMNAITTVQVLEELIQLAKDIRAARERGEETGLTDEEIAFYDALAENQSARDVMGEPTLRVIAHELLTSLKGNISVDWMHREAARARMRVLVKRILRKSAIRQTFRMRLYKRSYNKRKLCRLNGRELHDSLPDTFSKPF
jgi:type I restriction enzyme, R subunit